MSNIIKHYTNQNMDNAEDVLSEKTLKEFINDNYTDYLPKIYDKVGMIGVLKKVLCDKESYYKFLIKSGYEDPEVLVEDLFKLYDKSLFTSKVRKCIKSYYEKEDDNS